MFWLTRWHIQRSTAHCLQQWIFLQQFAESEIWQLQIGFVLVVQQQYVLCKCSNTNSISWNSVHGKCSRYIYLAWYRDAWYFYREDISRHGTIEGNSIVSSLLSNASHAEADAANHHLPSIRESVEKKVEILILFRFPHHSCYKTYHENGIRFHNHFLTSDNVRMIQISHNLNFTMNFVVVNATKSIRRVTLVDLFHCKWFACSPIRHQTYHTLCTRSQLIANMVSGKDVIGQTMRFLMRIVKLKDSVRRFIKWNDVVRFEDSSASHSNQFTVDECSISGQILFGFDKFSVRQWLRIRGNNFTVECEFTSINTGLVTSERLLVILQCIFEMRSQNLCGTSCAVIAHWHCLSRPIVKLSVCKSVKKRIGWTFDRKLWQTIFLCQN